MIILKYGTLGSGGGIKHFIHLIKYLDFYKIDYLVTGPKNLEKVVNKKIIYRPIDKIFTYSKALICQNKIIVLDCIWILPGFNIISVPQNMLLFDEELISEYSIFFRLKYIILRNVQLMTMLFSKKIMHISKFASDTINKKYFFLKKKPFFINPMGIDEANILNLLPRTNQINITYVSDIVPYKNHINLINSLSKVIKKGNLKIKLNLVGTNRISNELLNYKITHNNWIKFHGNLSWNELIKIYKNTDVSLFVSKCENSPNIVNELISLAIPTFVLNIRPMNEIIKDADFHIDLDNINDLESKLSRVLERKWIRKARKYMMSLNNFSWKNHVKKFIENI